MTAGPCFQTAAPTTRFLSLRLEPRCNCDPARAASLPGGRMARPALGPRPPKWRTWEPRAARSSQHPPPHSTPASSLPPLRILLDFFRVPQLACAMAQHFSFPLLFLGFLWPCSSLAPFYSSLRAFTLKSQAQRSKNGLCRNLGKPTGSLWTLGAAAESQRGALLHNVSALGNLPSLGVCQYD